MQVFTNEVKEYMRDLRCKKRSWKEIYRDLVMREASEAEWHLLYMLCRELTSVLLNNDIDNVISAADEALEPEDVPAPTALPDSPNDTP